MYTNNIDHKISQKNSTHNPNFEICMQFFKLCDEYYFITNIFHICWNSSMFVGVFFLIDCLMFKSNPTYFKQTKIIQDVMFILFKKNQMQNAVLVLVYLWLQFFGGVMCFYPKVTWTIFDPFGNYYIWCLFLHYQTFLN
jgi:hypothetical protein